LWEHKKTVFIGTGMVLLLTAALIARKINSAGRRLIAAAKKYVGIKESPATEAGTTPHLKTK